MDPKEYQRQALRTECDQEAALKRMVEAQTFRLTFNPIRLNHAALGLCTEAAELARRVEHWLYYGRPLDRAGILEELGDVLWYAAQACDVLGTDLGTVMAANLRKLEARYPKGAAWADRPQRDTAAERGATGEIVVQDGHGFGHVIDPEDGPDYSKAKE